MDTIIVNAKPQFSLGRLVATPGALDLLDRKGRPAAEFVARHVRGDWGDLSEDDKRANDEAVREGGRVFSSYHLSDGEDPVKVWVITEEDRSSTCVLLPEDY